MMKHGMHGILNMFQTNFFPETEKRIFIGLVLFTKIHEFMEKY